MKRRIRVLKYGGSSLATPDRVRFVARQIGERKRPGDKIVVVASAMGDTTDELLSLASDINGNSPARELDKLLSTGEHVSTALLAMALQRLGHDAVSLTGAQSGVHTSDEHFNARVERVDSRRVLQELSLGRIVVVAGFQGSNAAGEVTTLGLGGSDTSAVVLAAALKAPRCEICSDVDGVYSADPRVVERARRIDELGYAEMIEMARHGASVLNPGAVEHAREHHVEIYSRNTFKPDAPGTLVHDTQTDDPRVVGIAGHDALVTLTIGRGDADVADAILDELDEQDLFADHTDDATGRRHLLIPAQRLPDADSYTEDLEKRFRKELIVGPRCSSVSAIGLGVGEADHVRESSQRLSRQLGVPPRHDFADEHSVTCVVQPEQSARLMNVFHREFDCPGREAAWAQRTP
jgi:aspartate kinase